MSRKSKRLAGHQFHGHVKNKIAHPGYPECETPWWDEAWSLHYDMESPFIEAPVQPVALLAAWSVTTDLRQKAGSVLVKAAERKMVEVVPVLVHSDTTDWCSFSLDTPVRQRYYAGALCDSADGGYLLISGLLNYQVRKETEMPLVTIKPSNDCPKNGNGKVHQATIRDKADYARTMAVYNARCDAAKALKKAAEDLVTSQGIESDMIECGKVYEQAEAELSKKQDTWNAVSAASVLATKHPCPTI